MSTPDSTPPADWPPALLHLWNKFALAGEIDAQHPPATRREAYTQVVAIQLQHMREAVEQINDDVRPLKALDGPQPPTCCTCGASPLTCYVASLYTGATYCPDCAEQQQGQPPA